MRNVIVGLMRDSSYAAAMIFALTAPLMVLIGWISIQAGGFALLCSLFLVLISRIDTITEMSIGPMRAKMRDTINEAESILSHLRAVTRIIAKMSIAKFMMGNFWMGNVPLRQQFAIHDELISQMRKLGLSDEEIADADAAWKAGIKMMYVNIISNTIQGVDESGRVAPNQPDNVRKLTEEISNGFDKITLESISPKSTRNAIERYNLMSPELRQWVEDYDEFVRTGEIPRREAFLLARR